MNRFLILITFLFIAVFPLFSRDITVIIIDSDLDLPLEGAVIRTREGVELICDGDGKVIMEAPDNRQIIIYASYPGYETGVMTIPVTGNSFTVPLRLSGVLQGRELVVEAARPGSSETRTGRSVAVSQREIAQTAEIGIIEDVMSTIKLLPGVNYSGTFNAQPSIRGGHPGDMTASLDGFYINNPYFWGGGFSIFDPRMVQSAQLSHGVFSTRYGHTISGLLDITTKKPSNTETQFELGANSSAANFNLSLPLFGKGGILFMGRITYYDPVIYMAKQLSEYVPRLEVINFIRTAPYIRAGTITGSYRFTDSLEFAATGFWGMDGMSAYFLNSNDTGKLHSDTSADIDFKNYQGFGTTSLSWNPSNETLLKLTAGAGYEDMKIDAEMEYNIHNKEFTDFFPPPLKIFLVSKGLDPDKYQYSDKGFIKQSDSQFNLQGRLDFDWKLSDNLLVATGIQELFTLSKSQGDQRMSYDIWYGNIKDEEVKENILNFFPIATSNLIVGMPAVFKPDSQNRLLTSSGYILGEFNNSSNRFKSELGLRVDHFILFGDGFTLPSDPVLNPRLNIDFNIFKNKGNINSFDISAGSGLFSSLNSAVFNAEERFDVDYIKPNRSWTSVLGIRFEFPESLSLNIEGYYKYVFDRMYILVDFGQENPNIRPQFDGEGMIWGLDFMLQKVQSRYWDGWLAYSYNWTKYRDPGGELGVMGMSGGNRGSDWYFPSYHRFHNLNLVLNIKPVQAINIYLRFGFASGVQLSRRVGDRPVSYPVLIYNIDDPDNSYFIEKFRWESVTDENNRTTPSLPMDIKFSIFGSNKTGKSKYELYFAIENVLSLLYTAQGNTSFNQYTGEVDTGSTSASYEIPIPIPSFGFKISY